MALPRAEKEALAKRLNIKVHPRIKDENLVYKIMQQPQAYQNAAIGSEEAKPLPAFNHTEEDVMKALPDDVKNKEGFKILFPQDNTVIFTYRGISESVNMSVPMHVIVRQARMSAKTKYAPPMERDLMGNVMLRAN